MEGGRQAKPAQQPALGKLFGRLSQLWSNSVFRKPIPSLSPTDFVLDVHKVKMLPTTHPRACISFVSNSQRYWIKTNLK